MDLTGGSLFILCRLHVGQKNSLEQAKAICEDLMRDAGYFDPEIIKPWAENNLRELTRIRKRLFMPGSV